LTTSLLDSIGLNYHPNIITIIGLLVAATFLGSKLFQRFGIPQVVGYIVIGVFLGASFLNVVPLELSDELSFISEIALGLIGFDMGSRLYFGDVKTKSRSIFTILLFESLGTFALVTVGIYLVTGSLNTALIFGALSSATAPAATVDVLAEYDAEGPMTTSLLAVVGLDDAVSLLLYSLVAAYTESALVGGQTPTFWQMVELPMFEVVGSLLLGLTAGWILNQIMHRMKSAHDSMAVSIGFVLILVGLSDSLGLSLILTTMVMGMTVVNCCVEHGQHIRFTIEQAGPVIYVLFFALVGARFQVSLLPTMGLVGIVYVLLRTFGKFCGAWLGGALGGAAPAVRDNLGFGLLSQAGVAIGLALDSCKRFSELGVDGEALGMLIISVITATTFIVQIFGPMGVKLAIVRSGEIYQARGGSDRWESEGIPEN
jgi:Kef-type K+ transport system membrane component KefB